MAKKKGEVEYDDSDEKDQDWVEDPALTKKLADITGLEPASAPQASIADVDVGLSPNAAVNAQLDQQRAENKGKDVPAEELAEQDRKADAERTAKAEKEAEAEAKKAEREAKKAAKDKEE